MGYGVFHGEAGLMPKDREWAWWLTMRELAAVAGLALAEAYWTFGLVQRGTIVREASPTILVAFAHALGWEAPDA